MDEVTVSEARGRFADVVDRARIGNVPVYITRHGHRVAAVIASDELERLVEASEDLADLRAAQEARAELDAGADPIPWDEVKADLGLA